VPIEHMLQEARAAGTRDPVQVVVFTHPARLASIQSAFAEARRLTGIAAPPVSIRLEDV